MKGYKYKNIILYKGLYSQDRNDSRKRETKLISILLWDKLFITECNGWRVGKRRRYINIYILLNNRLQNIFEGLPLLIKGEMYEILANALEESQINDYMNEVIISLIVDK